MIDAIVGISMVRRLKLCVNMANFIQKIGETFCFSSANLKSDKPLCGALYCGPEPDVFLFAHNSSSSKISTFSSFLGAFSNFAPTFFYPVYDRNMANFKYSFDPPKAISFQIHLYRSPLDMVWVTALAYRVVALIPFA